MDGAPVVRTARGDLSALGRARDALAARTGDAFVGCGETLGPSVLPAMLTGAP